MLHVELVAAAAAAGKHVFCEKPVGGTPEDVVAAIGATTSAGVVNGVGYNYRWAPLVQYAPQLIADGTLGEITHYRGRFFSMYGSDPLGLLSWRFLARRGRLRRIRGPAEPLGRPGALAARRRSPAWSGPDGDRSSPTVRCRPGRPATTGGAGPDDPTGDGHQRGLRGDALRVRLRASPARSRPAARSSGPRARTPSRSTARRARWRWNLEQLNELQVYVAADDAHTG